MMVPLTGVEPARREAADFESAMSTIPSQRLKDYNNKSHYYKIREILKLFNWFYQYFTAK